MTKIKLILDLNTHHFEAVQKKTYDITPFVYNMTPFKILLVGILS